MTDDEPLIEIPDGFDLASARAKHSTTPKDEQPRCPECGSINIAKKVCAPAQAEFRNGEYRCETCNANFEEPDPPEADELGHRQERLVTDGGTVGGESKHPFDVATDGDRKVNELLADTDGKIAVMEYDGAIGYHIHVAKGETDPEYLWKVALLKALDEAVFEMAYIDAESVDRATEQLEEQVGRSFETATFQMILDQFGDHLQELVEVQADRSVDTDPDQTDQIDRGDGVETDGGQSVQSTAATGTLIRITGEEGDPAVWHHSVEFDGYLHRTACEEPIECEAFDQLRMDISEWDALDGQRCDECGDSIAALRGEPEVVTDGGRDIISVRVADRVGPQPVTCPGCEHTNNVYINGSEGAVSGVRCGGCAALLRYDYGDDDGDATPAAGEQETLITDGGVTARPDPTAVERRLAAAGKQLHLAFETVDQDDEWTKQALAAMLDDVHELYRIEAGESLDLREGRR